MFCNGADACNTGGSCTEHAGSPCGTSTCDESGDACTGQVGLVSIVSGWAHSCGLTAGGKAYCWGQDSDGQLGNGSVLTADQVVPSPVDTSGL